MTLIDTHTHLQFKAFENNVDEVINRAKSAGIDKIIVVGTDLETSKKAIVLVEKYEGLYASVGIHPHHVFPHTTSLRGVSLKRDDVAISLEKLISHPKVIAIGETGLDKHIYENTKYRNYQITEEFIKLQKLFFREQIKLAIKHKKTLIIHNREAVPELLEILEANWDPFLESRSVFHCCEPDHRLLKFAYEHNIFIGIDGDITYDKAKQDFMKQIPLELLVLETDSPYFIPEPLKSSNHSEQSEESAKNEPKNLTIISQFIANLKKLDHNKLNKITASNSNTLFNLKY